MGGLSRRNTALDELRKGGTPTFVVDAGQLFWKSPVLPEPQRAEQVVKAKLQAQALALSGLDAMLPADGDFALGRDFVVQTAKELDLPYVVGNLQCSDPLPFPPYRVVERGGMRMVFVGVESSSLKLDGCTVQDPAVAIAEARAERHDVLVVLSGQHHAEDDTLSSHVPGIDLIVNGADRQVSPAPDPLPGGGLWLGGGSRGKQLGRLDLTLTPGATSWMDQGASGKAADTLDRYSKRRDELQSKLAGAKDDKERERLERQLTFFQKQVDDAKTKLDASAAQAGGVKNVTTTTMLEMDADVADHAETAKLVAAAKAQLSGGAPEPSTVYTGPFVGSDACKTCHAPEYAQWQTTAHARAWASLEKDHRQGELSCAVCHSTGAQHPDGPKQIGQMLQNVGCESCHGPGRMHSADPQVAMTTTDPPQELCVVCHDSTNDGGRFDWATYRPQVAHK